jgi:sugar phosphate isomerase/epimerase
MLTRRHLLSLAPALAFGRDTGWKFGVTDWNLRLAAKTEAVELAKRCGFAGLQISLGRTPQGGKLPLANPTVQALYQSECARHDVKLIGTCLDILHTNYLKFKSDPLGPKWVAEGIEITRQLEQRVLLLPFFGKGALTTKDEMDYVGDVLRELAPQAEKAKVILALENTISAEDNVRIIDRAKSKAVQVYYDTGNSTLAGFDIYREIPWLGAKRICQIHFKDNPHYLGEGKIDFPRVFRALREAKYHGWVVLETDSPSKSIEADMKRNLTYLKQLGAKA